MRGQNVTSLWSVLQNYIPSSSTMETAIIYDHCVLCGTEDADLEQHHTHPKSLGGGDEPENLLTLCSPCHGKLHGMRRRANIGSLIREGLARVKRERGTIPGRKPPRAELVREAKRLARRSPKTGKKRSLRTISKEMAELGFMGPTGRPYSAEGMRKLLNRAT